MSIFKTKAIILKISKIQENNFLYTILSYEFWKIRVIKKRNKREKNLDIGYIINWEIKTREKNDIHKIWNIKISCEFPYEKKQFWEINSFLELLALINNNIPEKVAVFEIFDIVEHINKYDKISQEKITLWKLKVLNKLWILKLENKNPTVQKILKFIDKNNIKTIFKLTWIDDKTKKELERIAKIS